VGNVLEAMYFWMYDDGMNSGNIDCTPSNQSGCWGHRDNVLMSLQCQPCVMGTGYAANGYQGYPSWAEILVDTSGSPRLDFSWSQVAPYVNGSGLSASGLIDPDLQEYADNGANGQTWNVYDRTQTANGPGFYGQPSPLVDNSGTLHSYVWSGSGDLVEYVNQSYGGRSWNAWDLTYGAGAGHIAGSPDVLLDRSGLIHIYVQAANGDLMEYVDDNYGGRTWNAWDLSYGANSGPVGGTPSAFQDANGMIHIYVASAGGDLMEFVDNNYGGRIWNAWDLSWGAGGGGHISGAPDALVDHSGMIHVYVSAATGALTEYVPNNYGGHIWNAWNLSGGAGYGSPMAGSPSAFVDPAGMVHVYVSSLGGHLTEYVPDNYGGHIWNAWDLSGGAGYGSPVAGSPSALYDAGDGQIHVYVQSSADDLTEYVDDNWGGHIWNAWDISGAYHGPKVEAGVRAILDGNQIHIFTGG
jgi:hypothetical protein